MIDRSCKFIAFIGMKCQVAKFVFGRIVMFTLYITKIEYYVNVIIMS